MSESTDPIPQMGHVKDGEVKVYYCEALYHWPCEGMVSEHMAHIQEKVVTLAAYNELKEERDQARQDAEMYREDKEWPRCEVCCAELSTIGPPDNDGEPSLDCKYCQVVARAEKAEAELAAARARAKQRTDMEDALIQYCLKRNKGPGFHNFRLTGLCEEIEDERAALTSLEGGQREQDLV